MDYSKERKVKVATFLFQESAEYWQTLYATRGNRVHFIMWEEFKKVFKDQFYLHSFCDEKRKEFMNLVQGDMIVAE